MGLGWTYYRNLEAADFEAEAPAGDAFSVWRYIRNYDSCDVYFAGFRVGAPAPTAVSSLSKSAGSAMNTGPVGGVNATFAAR